MTLRIAGALFVFVAIGGPAATWAAPTISPTNSNAANASDLYQGLTTEAAADLVTALPGWEGDDGSPLPMPSRHFSG